MKRLLFLLAFGVGSAAAQPPVYVDKQGVMRWTKDRTEAAFFGVNYTVPFAYGYRSHRALGIKPEDAIDADVYHMQRLGLDAFRVHVWDVEISDSAGNLLNNEHLRLFDYLIKKLKERNIKILITPIAFWGNGYPERDEATPGFSTKYGKGPAVVLEDAIKAQEDYLKQFFAHINPYTKLTYTADPDVIAMEINNEPHHSGPKEKVTEYVNRLAAAVRSAGWDKPIFYNISESPYYAGAVVKANVDGHSFQWYPTGLVANHEQKGNFLPNVDQYKIPFDTIPAFATRAKMVYEFDAGDVMQPIMYPAMARSYRAEGFQWATQFAYDPMYTAYANTEYQTHYLNLIYTPAKAISLLIASKAFHKLPRGKRYGVYPQDTVFDVFTVSYDQQLSLMNDDTAFYYSNNTSVQPKNFQKLKHIAGVGNSPVAQYEGKGAYFLDKVSADTWRLEIMPDAIPLSDPFDHTSPQKEVTRIQFTSNKITFLKRSFHVEPGVYLISNGSLKAIDAEFYAPRAEIYNAMLHQNSVISYKQNNNIGWQYFFGAGNSKRFTKLVVRARSSEETKLNVSLITTNAGAFSASLPLTTGWQDFEIPLTSLKADSFLLLPRPYPGFLPLYFKPTGNRHLNIAEAEKIAFRFTGNTNLSNVEVQAAWLKK